MKTAILSVAIATGLSVSLASAATVIDFSADAVGNPLAPGTTIGEQYAVIGVHFLGSAFDEPDNPDDNFASNSDMRLAVPGGDVAQDATFPPGIGNFLHTYSGFTQENGDNNFAIVFDTPVTSVSMDIFDDIAGLTQMFAIEGDDILQVEQSFDSEDAAPQTLTLSPGEPFTVVGVILGSNIDWVAMDNLTFTTVPEPGAIAIATGGVLVTRRGRRRGP